MNLAQYKINGHLAHDAIASLSNFASIEEAVGAPGHSRSNKHSKEKRSAIASCEAGGVAFEYDLDASGRARIARCATDAVRVEVPATVDGHPVTEIGEHAFSTCYSLEHIGLPQDIAVIGKYAFMNTALNSFKAPRGLRVIARSAFYKCSALEEALLNEGLLVLGRDAFRSSSLRALYVPASVALIGQNAFKHTRLAFTGPSCSLCIDAASERYRLSDGALYEKTAGGWALLQVLDEDIRAYAGETPITAVADKAFAGLALLKRVTLPAGTLAIGDAAFKGCAKLTDVELPDTLQFIGKQAFHDTALRAFRVPAALEEVGVGALYTGGSIAKNFRRTIEHVSIAPENTRFYLDEGILCHRKAAGGVMALLYVGKAEHLVMPREVTDIGMYAFLNCTTIRSVELHDGVASIDVGGLDTGQSITRIVYVSHAEDGCVARRDVVRFPPGHAGRQAAKLTFARGSFDIAYAFAAADDAILATQDTYARSRMILERLREPVMLDEGMRTEFMRRIRRAVPATVVAFGKCGFTAGIDMLLEVGALHAGNIDQLIEAASDARELAALSRLMELKRTAFDAPMFDFDL